MNIKSFSGVAIEGEKKTPIWTQKRTVLIDSYYDIAEILCFAVDTSSFASLYNYNFYDDDR